MAGLSTNGSVVLLKVTQGNERHVVRSGCTVTTWISSVHGLEDHQDFRHYVSGFTSTRDGGLIHQQRTSNHSCLEDRDLAIGFVESDSDYFVHGNPNEYPAATVAKILDVLVSRLGYMIVGSVVSNGSLDKDEDSETIRRTVYTWTLVKNSYRSH